MAVKTRQQARAQASDSEPLEETHELPPVSTRPSLNKKRTARKPQQKPVSLDGGHNLLLDLPPELRVIIYEYCVSTKGPVNMMETRDVKKSPIPGLLSVNRQIREEVLPVFYKTNEFSFGRCHAKYITQWLFKAIQPQHLKLISAISWTSSWEKTKVWFGPFTFGRRSHNDVVAVYSKAAQDQAIHLSSVIMLLELGILGSCKAKMSLYNEPRLHVACALHQSTREIIARKKLTEADAWNADGVPSEDDVAGLAYVVAKDWGRNARRAFQDDTLVPSRRAPLAPKMYCSSCKIVSTSSDVGEDGEGIISRLHWVLRKGEGAETTSDQSEKLRVPEPTSELGSRVRV